MAYDRFEMLMFDLLYSLPSVEAGSVMLEYVPPQNKVLMMQVKLGILSCYCGCVSPENPKLGLQSEHKCLSQPLLFVSEFSC